MTDNNDNETALILAGEGYQLTIAPEAVAKKLEIMTAASTVIAVTSNDTSASAQRHIRSLSAMRILVDKSRKLVKEPVNRIGKMIDQAAKDFVADLDVEEGRIRKLVGDHAAEVARAKADAEAAERRAFEEARAAREAAEASARAAESSGRIADIIAAKQAEAERQEALSARMEASEETASNNVAQGVRFAIDFEVTDLELLASTHRELVTITPSRMAILSILKDGEEDGQDIVAAGAAIGLRVFKRPVVSSR